MKDGFYLSPCGKHIVQLTWKCGRFVSLDIDFIDDHIAFDGGYALIDQVKILLSGWERLE